MLSTIVLVVAIIITVSLIQAQFKRPKNAPPGPFCFPIMGNLFSLPPLPHKSLAEIGKRFNGVFSIWFGQTFAVIVTDAELFREAMQGHSFAGRPTNSLFANMITKGGNNIGFADYGPKWRKMRKLTHAALFSGSKFTQFEPIIIEELEHTLRKLEGMRKAGSEFAVFPYLESVTENVISRVTIGRRFEENEPDLLYIHEQLEATVELLSTGKMADYIPMLQLLPNKDIARCKAVCAKRDKFFGKIISDHKETLVIANGPRDLTDCLLIGQEDENNILSHDDVMMIIQNMMLAGQETTANSLNWLIAHLCANPDVQTKIQEEIDSVIGRDRLPTYADKEKLKYTVAAFKDNMRRMPVVPLLLPHKTTEDAPLGGYVVPKGTLTLFNVYAIHHDATFWKNPDQFDPTNFLDKNMTPEEEMYHFAPFGLGIRNCIGMKLAEMEYFLVGVSVLRKYKFSFGSVKVNDWEGRLGITIRSEPYTVNITARF